MAAYESHQDADSGFIDDYEEEAVLPVAAATENAPSTLPQILHLSFKNRAEYHLDTLQAQLKADNTRLEDAEKRQRCLELAQSALNDFSEALDKDEDDVDIWRRASKVSQALSSYRITRYCLESALKGDEEGPDDVLSTMNFESRFDVEALKGVCGIIEQDSVEPPRTVSDQQLACHPRLHTSLIPYKFLPGLTSLSKNSELRAEKNKDQIPVDILQVEEHTLDAILDTILKHLKAQNDGLVPKSVGATIRLEMPALSHDDPESHKLSFHLAPKVGEPLAHDGSSHRTSHTPSSESKAEKVPSETPAGPEATESTTQQPSPTKVESSRKRSLDAANLAENVDGERAKSRRTRARKSATADRAAETSGLDLAPGGDPKHETYLQADRWLFDLMRDVLRRMDVKMICNADDIRRIVSPNSPYGVGEGFQRIGLVRAMQDFYASMLNWSSLKTEAFNNARCASNQGEDGSNMGLLAFLDSTAGKSRKSTTPIVADAHELVELVNESFMSIEQVSVLLCQTLFTRRRAKMSRTPWEKPAASPYLEKTWSDRTKDKIQDLIRLVGVDLKDYVTLQLPLHLQDDDAPSDAFELAQTIFELHLDMFSQMTSPTSHADAAARNSQKLLVDEWSLISRELLSTLLSRQGIGDDNIASRQTSSTQIQTLVLRHSWASVFHMKAGNEITREHLTSCINELKSQIKDVALKQGRVLIQNNNAMPEISADAADREVVKLDTMDFFLSIFNQNKQHPVDLIEKLEPILIPDAEASGGYVFQEGRDRRRDRKAQSAPQTQSRHKILSEFVKKADPSLRLTLWYKLRDSYSAIDFPSKVLFINFRIQEVLMSELQSLSYMHAEAEERERVLLQRLKNIHDILIQTFDLVNQKVVDLECLETSQLKSSAQSMVGLFTLLHVVTLYDDYSQALYKGPSLPNPFRTYPVESFFAASKLLHRMQLHTFILLYKMMVETAARIPERISIAQANVDRYEYLQYVHYALGIRRLCKAEDSLFLHFMRAELLHLQGQPIINDVAQILYDLYDLRCFTHASEKQDHGCDTDRLDRSTAMDLVDFVLERTRGANIKDLPKADLGKSVEIMQNAIGPPSSTFAISRNRKILTLFMKTAINPLELFQSLRGISWLSTTSCPVQEAPMASKGWYFLIGMINLAKHKRPRENDNSKVAEDVNIAVRFLTHDLEFDAEKWETWFRLAHAYDWLLEEQVLWQSDKLQNEEVEKLERCAIHAYTQASALAIQNADPSEETRGKLATMNLEYAMRMYFSARPPFSMQAFSVDHFGEKLHSGIYSGGTHGQKPFQPLKTQQAIRIAASLCRQAISFNTKYWLNYFMLGKCYWKMYQYTARRGSVDSRLAYTALDQFHLACEVLERRRDPNRTEPTLEPMYKIVFVTEKLVSTSVLTKQEGTDRITKALKAQKHVDSLQSLPRFEDTDSWVDFVLKCLKQIRQADRLKWHHRVVYKSAQLIYKQLNPSPEAAQQAKDHLERNNMYSQKTAALTVWKPEVERPGRHWVYMTRYARFICKLLEETADAEFMQTFARRVRRKVNEFFDHTALWQHVLDAHLRLHRKQANIPEQTHTTVFADMNIEQFRPRAVAVDTWACSPETKHPLVDLLREIEEIKKTNNKLVSDVSVDDLMCDTYAHIFATIGSTLPIVEVSQSNGNKPDTSALHTPNTATPEPPSATTSTLTPEKKGVMSLSNMMNVDGTADSNGVMSNWRPISMPSNPPTAATFAIASTEVGTSMPRPRAPRSVTRRDILKHAQDASIAKVTAVKDKDAAEAKNGSDVKVVINIDSNTGKQHGENNANAGEAEDDGDASSELSDPDENADDEMDMNQLDGTVEQESSSTAKEESPPSAPKPVFPNLRNKYQGLAEDRDAPEKKVDEKSTDVPETGKKIEEQRKSIITRGTKSAASSPRLERQSLPRGRPASAAASPVLEKRRSMTKEAVSVANSPRLEKRKSLTRVASSKTGHGDKDVDGDTNM